MKPHVWYVGIASFVAALIMLLVQYVFTKRLTHELKVKTSDFSVAQLTFPYLYVNMPLAALV